MRPRLPTPTVLEAIAIALALAGVLTFVMPECFRPRGDPRATVRSDLTAIGAAVETYRYDTGHLPTTAQGLGALVDAPASHPRNWRGPYVMSRIPSDPWGTPYVYRRADSARVEGYVLSSYGADRKPGGRGDAADVTVRH